MRGYIVVSDNAAMHLSNYDDGPRGGLLLVGQEATVFESPADARRAIRRSIAYSRRHGYGWEESPYRIYSLIPKATD